MAESDGDLERRLDALEEALRELQAELEDERSRRLPRPTEVLRLTDEHAIPVAIAILEAHIHTLKFIQGLIRLSGTGGSTTQTEQLGRSALARLDDLVADLRATPMPPDAEARDLVEEVQDLRRELEERIEEVDTTEEDGTTVDIDVDEELDAIKSDVEDDDQSNGENR